MKRLISLLLVVSMLFLLSACSVLGNPFDRCRQHVISIGEQYLNFEITGAEAMVKLASIKVPKTDDDRHDYLETDIRMLLYLLEDEDSTYEEIAEDVEDIRSSILYTR